MNCTELYTIDVCIPIRLLYLYMYDIPLTKLTTAQNEVALNSDKVRGIYFLAVAFVATIFYFAVNVALTLLLTLR